MPTAEIHTVIAQKNKTNPPLYKETYLKGSRQITRVTGSALYQKIKDKYMSNQYSPKNFIKGKIVELIFDQMLRKAGKFTVIPFGYEKTLPEIAQHSQELKFQHILDNIRNSPDFALISQDKTEVFLVEVKYRKNHTAEDLIKIVEKIRIKWDYIWLFIVTPDGFYFDSCTNILNNGGSIPPLDVKWVSEDLQKEYLELLKEFIK